MVEATDLALARRCLEAYYERCHQSLPVVPSDMRCDPSDTNEWVKWKLIESKLTEADILELERMLPFKLPPLFRAFLISYCVLDMDFGDFLLPELPSNTPLKKVRLYLLQRDLWDIGYAQFGSNPYGDPLCFDLQSPTSDADFAIVVINHDMIAPFENWKYRDRVQPHAKKVGESFRAFFSALCLGSARGTTQ
jgi:hypothetical protein